MAWNQQPIFPVGYQPYMPQYQQPVQQYQQPQTKYVEVAPVQSVQEAEAAPMAAGASSLFFANDDSFICVKSVGVNGQVSFNVYDKRPPAPAAPVFNPAEYVRKDELQTLIQAAVGGQREDIKNESV